MPFNLGPLELVIILVIVLVVFGPKRLPGLGKQLGTGMREFRESIAGKGKDDDEQDEAKAGEPQPAQAALAAAPPEPSNVAPAREERPAAPTDA
jgi:sec-independent protein translocase protein TatA